MLRSSARKSRPRECPTCKLFFFYVSGQLSRGSPSSCFSHIAFLLRAHFMPKNIYPINQNQPGHYLAAMTILLQCSPTTTFVASPPFPSLLFYSFAHSFITYILHMCVRRTHFFSLIASSLPFYFTVFRVLFIHDISRCDVEANLRSLSYHISHLSPPPPSVLC